MEALYLRSKEAEQPDFKSWAIFTPMPFGGFIFEFPPLYEKTIIIMLTNVGIITRLAMIKITIQFFTSFKLGNIVDA